MPSSPRRSTRGSPSEPPRSSSRCCSSPDATEVRRGRLFGNDTLLAARLLALAMPLSFLLALGLGLALLPGVPWAVLLVLACAVVPIDFAAADSLVRDPRVPERVRDAINVEGGYNDGIASPVFSYALLLAGTENGFRGSSSVRSCTRGAGDRPGRRARRGMAARLAARTLRGSAPGDTAVGTAVGSDPAGADVRLRGGGRGQRLRCGLRVWDRVPLHAAEDDRRPSGTRPGRGRPRPARGHDRAARDGDVVRVRQCRRARDSTAATSTWKRLRTARWSSRWSGSCPCCWPCSVRGRPARSAC